MKALLVNNLHFDSGLDYRPPGCDDTVGGLKVSTPPLGILLLAAVLRQRGDEVEVVDFAHLVRQGRLPGDAAFYPEAARYLHQRGADAVGFSTRCDDYHCQLRIARGFKKLSPAVPVVFGGPHATVVDRRSLKLFPQIDFVVRNEGEETLPELLDVLADGGDLSTVAGLTWRRAGEAVANSDRPLIADLDAYPMPAYDLYPSEFVGRWPIEVGRGCPFSCTFCSTNVYFHRTYRLKSGPRVVAELRALRDRFGAAQLMFVHDMLTVDKKRVTALCNAVEEADLGVVWNCSARMDCIDEPLLDAMRAAGCDGIYMGIEAGSQRMQKRLRKNLHLERVRPTLATLKGKGFAVTTSFITGFEEETRDDVGETLDTLLDCLLGGVELAQLHLWAPQAGTVLFERGRERLAFDGYLSDQVDPIFFSDQDLRLILAHPDLFSAFYYVPNEQVPRGLYKGLDLFGYACSYFPQTLYIAFKTSAVEPLALVTGFQGWLARERGVDLAAGAIPMRAFHGHLAAYLEHRIDDGTFVYPYLRDVLRFNVAYTRFQHRPAAEGAEDAAVPPGWLQTEAGAAVRRAPDVEVHDFDCDVRRLIEVVNRGDDPPADPALARKSSIVLRQVQSKVVVLGLPVLCKAALALCDGSRSLAEVERALGAALTRTLPADKASALAAGAVRQLADNELVFPVLSAVAAPGAVTQGLPAMVSA